MCSLLLVDAAIILFIFYISPIDICIMLLLADNDIPKTELLAQARYSFRQFKISDFGTNLYVCQLVFL